MRDRGKAHHFLHPFLDFLPATRGAPSSRISMLCLSWMALNLSTCWEIRLTSPATPLISSVAAPIKLIFESKASAFLLMSAIPPAAFARPSLQFSMDASPSAVMSDTVATAALSDLISAFVAASSSFAAVHSADTLARDCLRLFKASDE